jgi:methylenetetrahydrofolate reductase (NADPH)
MREHLYGTIISDDIITRMDAAPDPKATGATVCLELLEGLKSIQGVAGAHIMAPLNERAVPAIIRNAAHLRT